MKSRVINSKHFHKQLIGDIPVYVGYTSELKPSLFYGNTEKENVIWLQLKETNKMCKFDLDLDSILEDDDTHKPAVWTYKINEKFKKKFPELIDTQVWILFDVIYIFGKANKQQEEILRKRREAKKKSGVNNADKVI